MAVQKAKSPSSVFTGFLVLLRALCIFFGGTVAAHWLGSRIIEEAFPAIGDDPAPVEPYFRWLGEAILPSSSVTEALGNSMLLGSAAVLIGLIVGLALAGLLRIPGIGVFLGTLALPSAALFVPGIVLFPLGRLALDRGVIPIGALADGQPLDQSLRFIGFWGLLVGLAIAPAVTAVTAGSGRSKLFGLATIEAPLASRSTPWPMWRFGLPLSSFGLAMASAEILSGHEGVFGRFYRSLQLGNVADALDLAVMVILAAAIVAVVVDLFGFGTAGGATPPGTELAQISPVTLPIITSRLLLPLIALLVMVGGAAGVGLVIDATKRSDPVELLATPSFGGPWLGTDEAGRSVLALTTAALGPALSAALIPGLVAVAIGLIVAAIRRASPQPVEQIAGATIDLLWWPLPMLVPLVALFSLTQAGQAEFQIGVLGLTGAMLAPLASRLIGRSVLPAATARIHRLAASWLYCSTIAFAAYLLAGFMGLCWSHPSPP